jgi:hypothetical protein
MSRHRGVLALVVQRTARLPSRTGVGLCCAAAAALLLAGPTAAAELVANDGWLSGQPVSFQAGFVAGETAAARLVPSGPCPCQLDEVRFLFGGSGGSHDVTLRVWDDSAGTPAPGAELYSTTLSLTGSNDFMQSVDLRGAGISVNGPFRVGLEFTHAGLPSVASDADGIDFGSNFIDEITLGWWDAAFFGVSGDWVIRAVLDSGTAGPGTLLANDGWLDGQPAYFQAGFVAGETAAVRLVPTGPCPCRLDRIQFLFGGSGASHDVTFRIWDDSALGVAPGPELYATTQAVTGSDEFMQEVDVSAVGLMIDGPIRIGMQFGHAGLPSVARDADGLTPGHNFVDASGPGWVESSTLGLTGDWIIRAVLDAAPASSGGTLLANDSWISGQAAAFQGGFAAGETAAARFMPAGPCPCPLEKIRFLFGGASGTHDVVLHVWDDAALGAAPGAELYSATLELGGSDELMQEVDVGVIGLEVNGPFRVGLEFTHAGLPSVARDADGITPDRNFIDASGPGWVESSTLGLTGDWIIRAVLGSAAAQGELVNNDTWVPGQAVAVQAGFQAGEIAAARFVPTGPCPCSVDRIQLLFAGAGTSETLILHVWEDGAATPAPGSELYSAQIQLTGSDLFLQELDLTVAAISVNGPFRVGFEFQHGGPPSLASDADGITPDRNFVDASGPGWVEASGLGISGDFVLRAVLDSLPGPLLASDSWASAAPAAFESDLQAGDTAAVRLVPQGPCPCPLEDVRFLLGGAAGSQVVTLRIWDDGGETLPPGAQLHSRDISLGADDQVLQVVDLHDEGLSVSGPFRVGIEFRHAGAPSVAMDADGVTPGRSFAETAPLGWTESSAVGATGDWVIRATLADTSAPPVPLLSPSGLLALAATLLASGAALRRR